MISIPYPNLVRSAQCLDKICLADGILSIKRLLDTLNSNHRDEPSIDNINQWNHPTDLGVYETLIEYGVLLCELYGSTADHYKQIIINYSWGNDPTMPCWMGDENFHIAQQSYLVRINPAHYRQYFPTVTDNIQLVRPSCTEPTEAL